MAIYVTEHRSGLALIADQCATIEPTELEFAGEIDNLMNNWDELGLPPLR
nr:hypothetical protein [Methylobacterium sp. L1A1]